MKRAEFIAGSTACYSFADLRKAGAVKEFRLSAAGAERIAIKAGRGAKLTGAAAVSAAAAVASMPDLETVQSKLSYDISTLGGECRITTIFDRDMVIDHVTFVVQDLVVRDRAMDFNFSPVGTPPPGAVECAKSDFHVPGLLAILQRMMNTQTMLGD